METLILVDTFPVIFITISKATKKDFMTWENLGGKNHGGKNRREKMDISETK